ncbi:MAG: DUF1566 domain-containing protein [Desulfobulbus sp.]
MALFDKLDVTGRPVVDWEMTPEYTFGTFESWGGKERVRSKTERIYYFFIDGWDEEPRLCLMERGIKYARVVAEIDAPVEMVQRCVDSQGKVALFERTYPINDEIKQWLLVNVMESEDDSKVIALNEPKGKRGLGPSGLPSLHEAIAPVDRIVLPGGPAELSEEDVVALVQKYNFIDQDRNPGGNFAGSLVDNGDELTVTDRVTGLMWQRGGLDIMSRRLLLREIEQLNGSGFAGYSDWRLPSMAEALSLLTPEKMAHDQFLPQCFSGEYAFVFVDAVRRPGGQWFVDFKQGRAYWASATIPGGFGRLCRNVSS